MPRILAVDPGQARIGIALSDPTTTIAQPLLVLRHSSRQQDAHAIVQLAIEHEAELILIGVAMDLEGNVGPQARKALRLVDALREVGDLPVTTWDESGSTQAAQRGRGKDDMLDARAAAFVLQEYLNAQKR